jgi:glycosyltransferase involved in cell wall biosynthesis
MSDKISVLMSVCNEEKPEYLSEAIKSVFDQTLMPEELILVKDGPLKLELEEIIKIWEKKENARMKVFSLAKNEGLARALNYGLEQCSCELVARMDSDDVSMKDRFYKQIRHLVAEELDVVGSYIEERDETMTKINGIRVVPLKHKDIEKYSKWRSPMNHVTVMFKKSYVISAGGYPPELRKMQDYALWAKLVMGGYRLGNLPESLVIVRAGKDLAGRRGGVSYVKYEFMLFVYLKKIGFLNGFEFLFGFSMRFLMRLLPDGLRSPVYHKFLRTRTGGEVK